VNLLGDNIDTIPKNIETSIDANKEVGLKINVEKTKYTRMLLSCHQNVGRNHDLMITNRSYENVAQYKHLGSTVIYQHFIQEEIKRRLNSGNACYHSIQNLLTFCLLCKNIKIRTYKTIILLVVLCGCETWSLTLREVYRLRMFESRVLRRIFGLKRKVEGGCITMSFITCTLCQV
jgi:hypothetical protein